MFLQFPTHPGTLANLFLFRRPSPSYRSANWAHSHSLHRYYCFLQGCSQSFFSRFIILTITVEFFDINGHWTLATCSHITVIETKMIQCTNFSTLKFLLSQCAHTLQGTNYCHYDIPCCCLSHFSYIIGLASVTKLHWYSFGNFHIFSFKLCIWGSFISPC